MRLFILPSFPLYAFLIWVASFSVGFVSSLQFRTATKQDVNLARRLIAKAKMNSFSITQEHLLVAYSNENNNNNKQEDEGLLGFGQIRPLQKEGRFYELASVYVTPKNRQQGIGSALVQELLSRHDAAHPSSSTKSSLVCLLTIRDRTKFYEKFGFRQVQDMSTMPSILQLEYKAGQVISSLLRNELVCMARYSNDSHKEGGDF